MDDYPESDRIPDPLADLQHHELMEFLVNNVEMKKAATHSMQQGMWAGAGAISGGLLLGPIGGLMGGMAGSLVGFMRSGNYEGAVQQVMKLNAAEKTVLVTQVHEVLRTAGAKDMLTAGAFQAALVQFASQGAVRDQIWRACLESVKH
jgi:hypothetical protein